MHTATDLDLLQRWCRCALRRLGESREEINAANVYPVPDSDTGTNLYLTVEAAAASLDGTASVGDSVEDSVAGFARAALLGAHGNSGVIVSQLIRAVCEHYLTQDGESAAQQVAGGLAAAATAAYAAVEAPVEGTILTVASAAAAAARDAAARADDLGAAVHAAAEGAYAALCHTPEQLDVLAAAGVVDAGGQGLCVLLDAADEVLSGQPPPSRPGSHRPAPAAHPKEHLRSGGPGYEVIYLLDADDAVIPRLRQRLAALGDSLVVVGGDGLWNVHVHVDDVGAAFEAGVEAGRPHRVRVTRFADGEHGAALAAGTRAVVTVAAGDGLASLFERAGAVVTRNPDRPGAADRLAEAVRGTGAEDVIVLPNDAALLPAAESAAELARAAGTRVAVIPTRVQVQGLAALAVHDPARGFDDDVLAMTGAAAHARHGAVTVATQDAFTMAGPCRPGDSLGVVEGDFAVVLPPGRLGDAAAEVTRRLLRPGGEMVTLVTGADSTPDLVDAVEAVLHEATPDVELVVHDGGQPRYPLLVGVE